MMNYADAPPLALQILIVVGAVIGMAASLAFIVFSPFIAGHLDDCTVRRLNKKAARKGIPVRGAGG